MNTFSDELKNKARDIVAQNMEKYSTLINHNHQTGNFDNDPSQNLDQNHDEETYFENMANS